MYICWTSLDLKHSAHCSATAIAVLCMESGGSLANVLGNLRPSMKVGSDYS